MRGLATIIFIGLGLMLCRDIASGQPFFEPPPPREKIERVQRQIEMMRMWRLTKELDLDKESAARLFPILSRYDKERMTLEVERFKMMRRLREAIIDDQDEGDERRVEELMEGLETNRSALDNLRNEERKELKKVLTKQQMARYILFQQRFEHDMKEMIRKHRRPRHPARHPEGERHRPVLPLPPRY